MKLLISDYLTKLCGTNLKGLEVWEKDAREGIHGRGDIWFELEG